MLLTCPGCHHTFKHFARENTDKVKCFCGTEVLFVPTPNSSSRIFFFSGTALVEWNNEPECFGTPWFGVYKPRCRFLIPKARR